MKTIRQWREEHNLTQQELADLVGCCRVTITHIESGLRRPRPDLDRRIHEVVGRGVII